MQISTHSKESRVHIQPGFTWDAQDAYLFDIDGTLLRSLDRVHFTSFASAIRQVTRQDVSLAGVSIHGSTDTQILLDACHQAGLSTDLVADSFEKILEVMRQQVAAHRAELELLLMPCIKETLLHLSDRGARLGVATGNLEAIGWIKLEEAGLREFFEFGGFSDRFPVRGEMVGNAARMARELAGPQASVCVVGDTPRDIQAARANSLPVIAVATGHYNFDSLLEYNPEVCASSLTDLMDYAGEVA